MAEWEPHLILHQCQNLKGHVGPSQKGTSEEATRQGRGSPTPPVFSSLSYASPSFTPQCSYKETEQTPTQVCSSTFKKRHKHTYRERGRQNQNSSPSRLPCIVLLLLWWVQAAGTEGETQAFPSPFLLSGVWLIGRPLGDKWERD